MASRKNKKNRNQKAEKESSDKTVLTVICIILVIGAFIAGGVGLLVEDHDLKKNCTAYADGEVVKVEVKGRRKHRKVTTYIEVYDSIFPEKEIVLKQGGYKEGQDVKVFYDPNDHSRYYVEGTSADRISGGIALIVFGVLMIFSGLLIRRACKKIEQDKK